MPKLKEIPKDQSLMKKAKANGSYRVPSIPKKASTVTKLIEIDPDLWEDFKRVAKANGHKLKEATKFGISAYMADPRHAIKKQ